MGIVMLALSHKNKREQNEMKKVKEKKIMRGKNEKRYYRSIKIVILEMLED